MKDIHIYIYDIYIYMFTNGQVGHRLAILHPGSPSRLGPVFPHLKAMELDDVTTKTDPTGGPEVRWSLDLRRFFFR